MSNNVTEMLDKTAFGELSVAELTPIFQYDFSYNINTKLWIEKINGGTVSIDNNRVKLSTGAGANQIARLESIVPLKYRAGQGAVGRFTYLFADGVSNSTQLAGIGDEGNGLFFGYNGSSFGILRRYGGNKHVHELQITTASTTTENITITLNGSSTGANIAVTNSGNVTTTANEIAAYNGWNTLGDGWKVHAEGDMVIFSSFNAENKNGGYSMSATTAAGTFSVGLAGVTQTDSWVPQTSWNQDTFDGTGDSGITLDPTKGNVYQIRYQWLGFGRLYFYIESPNDGTLELVHSMDYANANTVPSFYSPTIPVCFLMENTSNTTDLIGYSSSAGLFTEGIINGSAVHHSTDNTVAVSTTKIPLLTLHNKYLYAGKINRNRIKLIFLEASADTNKQTTFRFYTNGVLTNASFTDIDTNDSMVSFDTAATAISGGDKQFSTGGAIFDLTSATLYLYPGQTFTVTQEGVSGSSGNVSCSINWEEDF